MRSSSLLRRTRTLPQALPLSRRALLSSSGPARYPRRDAPSAPKQNALRGHRRSASFTPPAKPDAPPSNPKAGDDAVRSESNADVSNDAQTTSAAHQLPREIDILWTAESLAEPPAPDTLPPPEILEEALNNLSISLHPQTQHRATYIPSSGPLVEPTLALYCPIEGGDYIVDNTIRELARRTGSDVVVLDAVQLAAGEWGHFGKAATVLQFPQHPLHFPSAQPPPPAARPAFDEDDDDEYPSAFGFPSRMTLHVVTPHGSRRSSNPSSPSATNSRLFFDQIVNIRSSKASISSTRRPRIIYVRDFSMLAASSASWYPPLLSAVRQRRQGAMASSASPVEHPVTVVFGMTPSITSSGFSSPSSSSGTRDWLNGLVIKRDAPTSHNSNKVGRSGGHEDEVAEKARERRLRDRLRKWERGDATLQDELPKLLASNPDGDDTSALPAGQSGVVIVGGGMPASGLPSILAPMVGGRAMSRSHPSKPESNSGFFRTSILVPLTRSTAQEKSIRMARRREINELTMRMGVGAVGGIVSSEYEPPQATTPPSPDTDPSKQQAAAVPMVDPVWEQWGERVMPWNTVQRLADRAVGSAVSLSLYTQVKKKPSLSPVSVSWDDIRRAWTAQKSSRELRRTWLKESVGVVPRERDEDGHAGDEGADEGVDEVIERVKRDPELEPHEQRLLGCIVDAASMPTSFSQVHLPATTIDSVRTIASLPLLHPTAFQHGILKEHGMTGCLLFGPPGTGKTLVVRALAKEAGTRMLAISPSDVMDMYVGEGEKLVKSVFSLARRLAPCVVFIDEIDALFGARSAARETGGAMAHRGVITEFMQEMDGLKTSKEDNVIVIGATNRPFDLDDAVLRRLPRRLLVDLPGEAEREEILKILLRDETLEPEVDLKDLAKQTTNFSGSDLKHLCVAAALDAVKGTVTVPWATPKTTDTPNPSAETKLADSVEETTTPPDASNQQSSMEQPSTEAASATKAFAGALTTPLRILRLSNFTKALKEITPSSSESLGTLSDLRRWNNEFGEGRKQKKKQVWGKDRFGFTNQWVREGEVKVTEEAPESDAT